MPLAAAAAFTNRRSSSLRRVPTTTVLTVPLPPPRLTQKRARRTDDLRFGGPLPTREVYTLTWVLVNSQRLSIYC